MKTFKELKAGDSLWIWWYNELYEYGIQDIIPLREFMVIDGEEKELQEIEPKGNIQVNLKGGASFQVCDDDLNMEAFVWGTDGWHEYKILGTSKEAVRECLEKCLERDMEELKEKTKKWLANF